VVYNTGMDVVEKRVYVSIFILIIAIIGAVLFVMSRPQDPVPVAEHKPVATSTPTATYTSNESSYTILGLTYTVPWDLSCNGLGKTIDPIISIQYPQIQGLKDEGVEQNINLFLENEFLTEQLQHASSTCGTIENLADISHTGLEVGLEIKLQSDEYLSLKYFKTTGVLSSLRPTTEYHGYTIDLDDGSVVRYRDLFKADSESRQAMKVIIVKNLPKEVKSNPDIGRDILDYDFYLTKDSVVFFNIFLSPVYQGIEVKIPFTEIEDLRSN
jgi:hypothetical protein